MSAAEPAWKALLEGFRSGRTGALARAISWMEDGADGAAELLQALDGTTGSAWRTGVTGPPGAGKSTLVDALTRRWIGAGRRTALLAVDPSSPLSGGALLGDRVRMDRAAEAGVFVRSMASRGSLGGLSLAAGASADLLDAFGYEEIVLETVGVGQAEVDIAAAADVTLVVLTPSSGDGVQTMKAGLMEVADIFVVNKADQPGAERLRGELESMLELRAAGAPRPEVLTASARDGKGIEAVAEAVESRRAADEASGRLAERRSEREVVRVRRLVTEGLRRRLWEDHGLEARARAALDRGERAESVAARLVRGILEGDRS